MSEVIRQYERCFSDLVGVKKTFAFWKGRVALYTILKAMGIGAGDEVVLPGYTCVVNVNPIKYLGAKPIYVDIEPDTFNINTDLLEGKLTEKTKVIIAQHTYGYPCDMDAIMNIADKNSVPIVEDCCLALSSKYKGKMVGTFGKAAYFSFQWNKPYTTGLGGMILTSDEQFAEKVKSLCDKELCKPSKREVLMLAGQLAIYRAFVYPRTTAFMQSLFRYLTRKGVVVGSWRLDEHAAAAMAPNFFKAMSIVQACSGLRQLEKIEENFSHRKKMARFYDQLLEEQGWPTRQYNASIMDPVMVRYPVRIAEKNKALAEAAKVGIELGSWFESPLHPIETPLAAYNYDIGMCPQAEKASNEVVNLPLHPRVNERTVRRTVEFITNFTKVI